MNREHYDGSYRAVDRNAIAKLFDNFDEFFEDAMQTDTSWHGMYDGGFAKRLSGKRVLELGCGNGINALAMAYFGAEVVAVDISDESARVVNETAQAIDAVGDRVTAIAGDFTQLPFKRHSFDCIVGKAFLHHLTHELESEYLARAAELLRSDGEARFFEPAVNSRTLDRLRWLLPISGRPSSLQRAAFQKWKETDPHPDRDNSTKAYLETAANYFDDTQAYHLGSIERIHKLLPGGSLNRRYRRWAHRVDAKLPNPIRLWLARSQLLVYRGPRPNGMPA